MLKRLAAAFVCLLIPSFVLLAQTPQAIDSALADLSQRVGHPVAINDLLDWTFAQSNYPDASLGCPQPGVAYAQVVTSGVQFMLTYAGNVYDYRVSADRSTVILCSTNAAPTPNPSVNCPPPGDAAYLPPRLTIGQQARVTEGGIPNLLRDGPGQSGRLLGEIPPGGVFNVLDGPRCTTLDKIIWWQVNYNGTVGWTAEGQAGSYWLEPLTSPNAVATLTPTVIPSGRITADNATQLVQIGNLGQTGPLAFSPDGKLAVRGVLNGGITIYNAQTGAQLAILDNLHPGSVSAIAFGADGRLLATAGMDGSIIVWDIGHDGTFGVGRSFTQMWGNGDNEAIAIRNRPGGVSMPIYTLTFSPDGLLLAGGGEDKAVRLWNVSGVTAESATTMPLMSFSGHNAPVVNLSFSNDATRLFSVASDGSALILGLK